MATITSSLPSTDIVTTKEAGSPVAVRAGEGSGNSSRQLWQVPVFLAGVGVLVSVCLGRPLGGDHNVRQLDRTLANARKILNQPDGDPREAANLARRALDSAQAFPGRLATAQFLLGSAEVRLAERASTLEGAEFWKSARRHLEEAERLGVSESDRGLLQYRLAKTLFFIGEDPQLVAEQLASTVDAAVDHAEGYRLLTEAYLRLRKPNLEEALKANERLRAVFQITPEQQALAQLQAGELNIRLGRAEAARKVLEKIGPQAPAGVLAQARVIRARSFQTEGLWEKAAEQWKTLLSDPRDPLPERGPALYHLGLCLARLNPAPDAAPAPYWEECLKVGKGEEVAAAALALAEVYLLAAVPEKAFVPLARAVEGIEAAADWRNTLVDLEKTRERFEQAVQEYRKTFKFDLALKTLDLYQKLAVQSRVALLRGEVSAEWAKTRSAMVRQMPPGDARNAEEEAVRSLYHAAADWYLKGADGVQGDAREEAIWLAALCLIEGQDERAAVLTLNRYLQIGKKPERVGEAWFRLGECHRKDGSQAGLAAAEASYKNCIQCASAFQYRARYQLALAMIARHELDEAEATLESNVKQLRKLGEPDPETMEKSLFALGDLAFQRKNYRLVDSCLRQVLKVDPPQTTAEATLGRFQLAESCRQLADEVQRTLLEGSVRTPEEVENYQKERRRWLLRAADEYLELARFLDTLESAGQLNPEVRIQVPFLAAICRFNLGEYDTALEIYAHLAERFSSPVAATETSPAPPLVEKYPQYRLEALAGVVRCHAALGQPDKVRLRLNELQAVLALPEVEQRVRDEYEKWIRQAAKSLAMP